MGFVATFPVLELPAEETSFYDKSFADLDKFVVLFLEVDVVGKNGAFTNLLEESCHVVGSRIPCLAHSFCVGVDVEGVDLAPFVEDMWL